VSEETRQGAANLLKTIRDTATRKRDYYKSAALEAFTTDQGCSTNVHDSLQWASVWAEVCVMLNDQIKAIEPRDYDPA
jgi:hypothetical protein